MQDDGPISLRRGTHTVAPDSGSIQVLTYREGMAQKVGHDLIIDVTGWEATVDVDDAGSPTTIALEVDSRSLRVREGLHGVKPLTDKDRAGIERDIEEKILRGRPISFRSTDVGRSGNELVVQGTLTIVDAERPASFQLKLAEDGRVTGRVPVTQSTWGVKPYRAFMGALKVRDTVEVTFDIRLSTR
jgi:YceI-like domain